MKVPARTKLLFLGDLGSFYLSLALTLLLRGGPELLRRSWPLHLLPFSILCVVWLAVFYAFDMYTARRSRLNPDLFEALGQAMITNALATAAFFYIFLGFGIAPKANLALHLVIFTSLVVVWRPVVGRILYGVQDREPVLFFEPAAKVQPIIEYLARDESADHRLAGIVVPSGAAIDRPGTVRYDGSAGLTKILRESGATTVVADPDVLQGKGSALSDLLVPGVTVIDAASFWEEAARQSPLEFAEPAWFVAAYRDVRKPAFEMIKRIVDISGAAVGLISLSWLMLLIAIAVRISSRGGVLYKQRRIGLAEKEFVLYKFRTMIADAEKEKPRWAAKDDPRVTVTGKFLRHTHLDELPQLWNIFLGDMSFVGPRPERPEFVALLKRDVPYYALRHLVKPGLTGWAQVNYRYGSSVADAGRKLAYDLYYVRHRSPLLDSVILIRTTAAFLRGEGW